MAAAAPHQSSALYVHQHRGDPGVPGTGGRLLDVLRPEGREAGGGEQAGTARRPSHPNGSLARSLGVNNAACRPGSCRCGGPAPPPRLLVDHMASRGQWRPQRTEDRSFPPPSAFRGVNRTSILSSSGTLNNVTVEDPTPPRSARRDPMTPAEGGAPPEAPAARGVPGLRKTDHVLQSYDHEFRICSVFLNSWACTTTSMAAPPPS